MMRNTCVALGLILLLSLLPSPGYSDDIEIYLGASDQTTTLLPNVLFIMDTSGSMSGKDGTGETRLVRVQDALRQVLNTTVNVNVGLMRFTDPGGPILYPVKYIDALTDAGINKSIQAGSADIFEKHNGHYYDTDALIELKHDGDWAGLRFESVKIPRGAKIKKAKLTLFSAESSSQEAKLKLAFEKEGEAVPFSSVSPPSTRVKTDQRVWETNGWPGPTEPRVSPNLKNQLQELVDLSDWCGGNPVNVLIERIDGRRKFYTYEQDPQYAAKLEIEYDAQTATGCIQGTEQWQITSQGNNVEETTGGSNSTGSQLDMTTSQNRWIGVRFENLPIPQGVTIESAKLVFTARENTSASSVQIYAEDADNPVSFPSGSDPVEARSRLSGPISWSTGSWNTDNSYESPELKTLVQSLVNRSGWSSGNAMAFHVKPVSGHLKAYTFNGSASRSAKLLVTYRGNADPASLGRVRDKLISSVDLLTHKGHTPIVNTLYEAALYFGGRNVKYGLERGKPYDSSVSPVYNASNTNADVRRLTRVSHRESYTGADSVLPSGCNRFNLSDSDCAEEYIPSGAVYNSPVTDTCQGNHIVLLSDGEANHTRDESLVEALLGSSCSGNDCGPDLAQLLNSTGIAVGNDPLKMAKITTHTIGFATSSGVDGYLGDMANVGGGSFYTADNADNLVTAFEAILREARDVNTTFVSPGLAVNQFNRLTHSDILYFALFHPEDKVSWPGNLKKYKLSGDQVVGQSSQVAIDPSTGLFKDDVKDFYSSATTGNRSVKTGGVANLFPDTRKVYSDVGSGGSLLNIVANPDAVTNTMLEVSSSAERAPLINWLKGLDDAGNNRNSVGDPLHSQPVAISYPDGSNGWDDYIFMATNQGYLHAFDADTGIEAFAFYPQKLLNRVSAYHTNQSSFDPANHLYGIDGDLVVWQKDANTRYLYAGMRRGGNHYYALDVSNINAPSLKFKITPQTAGYSDLGQTWSKPVLTKVKIGSTVRTVLVFGGGYDTVHDDASKVRDQRAGAQSGNSVYMADAETGELLWQASDLPASAVSLANYRQISEMKYSVAAKIAVIDRDKDGLADHLYVADLGGQLIRLDINNGETGADFVTGGRVADLGSESNAAANRRFYYAPEIARHYSQGGVAYMVALGSGYRAHPLDTVVNDKFFVVRDAGAFIPKPEGQGPGYTITSRTISEMFDNSDHVLGTVTLTTADWALLAKGFYLSLNAPGEKSLSSPMVVNHKIVFTTYLPEPQSANVCTPPEGEGRAYLIELLGGNALEDLNNDGAVNHQDRYVTLTKGGIPPSPRLIFTATAEPIACIGTECAKTTVTTDANGNAVAHTAGSLRDMMENLLGDVGRVIRGSTWFSGTEYQTDSQ